LRDGLLADCHRQAIHNRRRKRQNHARYETKNLQNACPNEK
jgi:hypothetical protein